MTRCDETPPVFTIGHSTRTIPEFVRLLRAGEAELVVDIRTVPRSRTNPHYNHDVLPDELAAHRIRTLRIEALGGLRRKSALPPEINAFWTNQSFHNYADYALSAEFRAGFDRLLDLASGQRCAIMCAESVWWRCHRRIVADHLIAHGVAVVHIMSRGRSEPARLTGGAIVRPDRTVIYPAAAP